MNNEQSKGNTFLEDLKKSTLPLVEVLSKYTCMTSEERQNMVGTGERVAKAMSEMILPSEVMISLLRGYAAVKFPVAASATDDDEDPSFLSQTDIRSVSVCPHHLLPVEYTVSIVLTVGGGDDVYGLSKYVRAIQTLAKRPVVQEQYGKDIVNFFGHGILPNGEKLDPEKHLIVPCAVKVVGSHGCMTCRGVHSKSPTTTRHYHSGHLNDANKAKIASILR